jgi:hypothetical protein
MVMTMKVPPTSTAATAIVSLESQIVGSATPAAMTRWVLAHARSRLTRSNSGATTIVERAAAAPKIGHARPNTAGSSTTSRATAGRKVAGRM